MNILVTGSNGLLGKNLVLKLKNFGYNVFETSRSNSEFNIDLCDYDKLLNTFNKIQIDIIFNLSAFTKVDDAELNYHECFKSNITSTINIVDFIKQYKKKIKLIHISTDQLYNFDNNTEENINIMNTYSLSKYISELIVKKTDSLIFRTNFFGRSISSNRKSFSDWIYENLKGNNSIELFDDVYFSPLRINTLNEYLIKSLNFDHIGIFNLGSKIGFSKYQFGIKLAKILQMSSNNIKKQKLLNKKLIAKRPFDMRMNCTKFEDAFNANLPSLDEEIIKLKDEYNV